MLKSYAVSLNQIKDYTIHLTHVPRQDGWWALYGETGPPIYLYMFVN